jgi:Flp pilus assembly protein TadG
MNAALRPGRRHIMRTTQKNQRGTILVLFAILLIVLLGFGALAIDVGNWYAVQAELSKSVDAAALAGARNISNEDKVDMQTLVEDFGRENFPAGLLGTPDTGAGIATFTASYPATHRVSVTGAVKAPTYLAKIFGVDQVITNGFGVASMNRVEIMLVLDRSGSMGDGHPTKISDLKTAAKSFVGFFTDTQDTDKMGLVSFSTTPTLDLALNINYVSAMITEIDAMSANDYTNAEDAIAQGGAQLPDQSSYSADQRVNQFLIFFSDGMPTALRSTFKYNNTVYDGVVHEGSGNNCSTTNGSVQDTLYKPVSGTWSGVNPATTGDGKSISTTNCMREKCRRGGQYNSSGNWVCQQSYNPKQYEGYMNTKWYLFETTSPGRVSGYATEYCSIPANTLHAYFCAAAKTMAINNAQALKDRGVIIYVVGLGSGTEIDEEFLSNISSGDGYTFIAPTSAELEAIFNKIAKEIKLRLVQ